MIDLRQNVEEQELKEMNLETYDNVFKIKLEKVIEERCDELDHEIESCNFEIIHRELKRVATSIYNYDVYFIE